MHEREGLLVEPFNVEAFSSAIRRLIGDPDLRRTLGQQGRDRAIHKLDWQEIAKEYGAAFDAVESLAFPVRIERY
jgi:glycosyltransferase involved in cell wall biosynthesis